MAASLLGRLFHSDASSHNDNDTNFPHGDHLNVPSNSPVTHTQSRLFPLQLPSLGHIVVSEQITSSSAMPVNELLSDPELPRSIEPKPTAGQLKLEPSSTSKDMFNPQLMVSKGYDIFVSEQLREFKRSAPPFSSG